MQEVIVKNYYCGIMRSIMVDLNQLFFADPYRMVAVNILALSFLLLSLLIFRFKYPDKRLPYPLLIILCSTLPIISIFRHGSYESGDLTINGIKLISFYNALKQGHLIPRWSANLNATYGYPNFVFAYPLPYYLGSFFHFLGFNFINSIKALLIFSYLTSGLAMYFWLKQIIKSQSAFVGAMLFQFAPYHLVDMHFRVDIGEMLALVFVPLTFLLLTLAAKKKQIIYSVLASFSLTMLILSHQAVSFLAFPILILYSITYLKKYRFFSLAKVGVIFGLGLLLSAYYWLPVLMEAKFTHQVYITANRISFPQFKDYLYSPYRFGFLFQGPMGELSLVLGYAHWIALFALTVHYFKKGKFTKDKDLLRFFIVIFLIYFFLMQAISEPVWEVFSILKKIEFPMRILSVIIVVTSAIAALASEMFNSRLFNLSLVSIAVITSILNWGNRRAVAGFDDQILTKMLPLSTYQGEGLGPAAPIWAPKNKRWQDKVPDQHIEPISGQIRLLVEQRKLTHHSYIILAPEEAYIRENTYYFPGWELYINGQRSPIIYDLPEHPGIITFKVQKGEHQIDLIFRDTKVRKYSFYLSIMALLTVGILLLSPTPPSKPKA